jgi:hypothetical protein
VDFWFIICYYFSWRWKPWRVSTKYELSSLVSRPLFVRQQLAMQSLPCTPPQDLADDVEMSGNDVINPARGRLQGALAAGNEVVIRMHRTGSVRRVKDRETTIEEEAPPTTTPL